MKFHPTLLAVSALLALLSSFPARADDGVLSFELAEPQWANEALVAKAEAKAMSLAPAPDPANQPLPIPARAVNPPMRYHSPQQLPAGVYRRGVAVALNESTSATALLPPAPPAPDMVLAAAASPEPQPQPEPQAEPKAEPKEPSGFLALDFGIEPSPAVLTARAELAKPKQPANPLLSLFDGDSDSLVAWAVGSAEGTRTPNGAINPAYFGHTDPGNRVWNMGTFSYQHGASTPTEADQKQLARLKNQGEVLRQRALKHGLTLTLEETLNGLDLANQSPLASIGRVGYIERLVEAKANGYEGSEAIVVARTRSYINPNTGRWNAPGLGNTELSIRRDQKRRADAVANAIAAYEAKDPNLQPQTWTLTPSPEPETLVALDESPAEAIDDVLQMWTSPSDPVAQRAPELEEPIAVEPAASTDMSAAPEDDRLAALWQLTVDRFAPIGGDDESMGTPQVASLTMGLFGRAPRLDSPTAADSAFEAANGAEASGAEVNGSEDSGTQLGSDSVALEPAAAVEALIAIPTWAETREAEQTAPAAPAPQVSTSQTIPGAVPDSAVYVPAAAPDAEPEFAEELVVQPELSAPAIDLETAPETELEKNSEGAIAPPAESSEQTKPAEAPAEAPQSASESGVIPEQLVINQEESAETVIPHPALAAAEGAAVEPEASLAEASEPAATMAAPSAENALDFDKVELEDLSVKLSAEEIVLIEPAPGDVPALSTEQSSSAEGNSQTPDSEG